MTDCMVILRDYIDNDPNGIEQYFIAALYLELTGAETTGAEIDVYYSSLVGRYKSPRMKNTLGSTIEVLKLRPEITSVDQLVSLLYEVRGPSLTAAEFISEIMSNGLVSTPE